jgi:O-antigen/teichoic acid export membrane protein
VTDLILRNAAFRTLSRLSAAAVGLITAPLLASNLGQEGFGLWLLVMSLASYAGLVDLGMTTALTKYIASNLALEKKNKVNRILASGLALYLVMGLLVLCGFVFIVVFLGQLFNISPDRIPTVRVVLLVVMLGTILNFPRRCSEALLLAQERHYLISIVGATSNLVRLGLIVLAFALGGGLFELSVLHAGVMTAGFTALFLMARRSSPGWVHMRPAWDKTVLKELFAYVRNIGISIVGDSTRSQAPTILLGALVNPGQVALFGPAYRIVSLSQAIVCGAIGVSMARFARLTSLNARQERSNLFLDVCLHSSLLGVLAGMGVFFLGPAFINIWMGPDFVLSARIAQILALPLALSLISFPCYTVSQGIGRLKTVAILSVFEAVMAVAAMPWLILRYGAEGAAIALAISMVILRPWVLPVYTCRQLELQYHSCPRQIPN